MGNIISDEKYIFHVTNYKSVDTRIDFVKAVHEGNVQPSLNDAIFAKLNGVILKEVICIKFEESGKFLSAVSETTDGLLRENISDVLPFAFQSGTLRIMLVILFFFHLSCPRAIPMPIPVSVRCQ